MASPADRFSNFRSRRPRCGAANAAWVLFIGSIVALAVLIALLVLGAPKPKGAAATKKPLIVYCAAGIKPPVEAVAKEYEQQFGVPIQLQYGASQSLLTNAQTSKTGDLYLPADESYIELAKQKGLTAESIPLARMTVILAVARNNPKRITSITDLLKPDVRVAQANPDAAAVGKATRETLAKTNQWDELAKHTLVFKGTVNDVANDIKLGAVDAGFIWDAMLHQYPTLERVDVPELKNATSQITISVLKTSEQPTAALRFARYLGAKDKGLKAFAAYGYETVEGDLWSATPSVNLFAGAMLRPAIEETIQRFEMREGCRVNRVYNGCGILVGEMKKGIGPMPDAYFSCDTSFMKEVRDLFLDQADISTNQLVILVPKGNPRAIHTLKDLGKPGIRLGVGHEKQCALGALTATTLEQAGLRDPVRKNVVAESATGDMLVNQLCTGSLDAVIAYISNAANSGDKLEAMTIDIPCAIATQPIAVSRQSQNKHIAGRLMAAIESDDSRQLFLANGFGWKRAGAK
ncbi:MAG: putative binding protein precursor [Phycisphaerales bacterium]|nr:putative binding protein precursor [Phycisphaerales bacterium]